MPGIGCRTTWGAAAAAVVLGAAQIALGDDGYIRGYASALAQLKFHAHPAISVHEGAVTVEAASLPADDRESLLQAIKEIDGVTSVEVVAVTPPANASIPAVPPATSTGPSDVAVPPTLPAKTETQSPERDFGWLPKGHTFERLAADPRWPDISGTYQNYSGVKQFESVGATNFGGSLPIYRWEISENSETEFGLQAGVFAIFNLDAESHDLVNADYDVALYESYRIGKLSAMGRVLHNSSHLGDEYLIHNPTVTRVNFSYEQLELLLSYDLTKSWRIYGGAGYLFDQDPDELQRWSVHYGLEWQSQHAYFGGLIRPIAAIDMKNRAYEDWTLDLSARAGIQIEGGSTNKLQLMLEYYQGRNPNGQLYTDPAEWYGIGLHWIF